MEKLILPSGPYFRPVDPEQGNKKLIVFSVFMLVEGNEKQLLFTTCFLAPPDIVSFSY